MSDQNNAKPNKPPNPLGLLAASAVLAGITLVVWLLSASSGPSPNPLSNVPPPQSETVADPATVSPELDKRTDAEQLADYSRSLLAAEQMLLDADGEFEAAWREGVKYNNRDKLINAMARYEVAIGEASRAEPEVPIYHDCVMDTAEWSIQAGMDFEAAYDARRDLIRRLNDIASKGVTLGDFDSVALLTEDIDATKGKVAATLKKAKAALRPSQLINAEC